MVVKKRNRRTLKKRIRRIISLSTLITVMLLSGAIISLIIIISTNFARFQSDITCYSIQQELNSGMALKPLGIESIEELNQNSHGVKILFGDLNKKLAFKNIIPYMDTEDFLHITVRIKDEVVYTNEPDVKNMDFTFIYEATESVKPIFNSSGIAIGTVMVRVNAEIFLGIVLLLLIVIIAISLVAFIISSILNRFLSIPIIIPLKQLETKFKAIAEEDQETALSTQIVLKKRPLREIESLVDSTNSIMGKLAGYNEILESQNEELEAQNIELTESKLQIQEQQAQLLQSERMASVGQLTAAITHEINTPIGAINSNAQIVDMLLGGVLNNPDLGINEELNEILKQIKETNDINLLACSRIIEIIKSLKTFSRIDQAEFQEADINEGLRSVLVLTNNLLKRRIKVHEDLGNIPPVKCFPGQLNLVFMNIIVNASQAIEGDGDIYIKTFKEEDFIFISIKDTGIGIEPENLSKIFEPGFSTKGVGVGLGLGLFISFNIIQNHMGEISVKSEPGKGAEFIIKIPAENLRT